MPLDVPSPAVPLPAVRFSTAGMQGASEICSIGPSELERRGAIEDLLAFGC